MVLDMLSPDFNVFCHSCQVMDTLQEIVWKFSIKTLIINKTRVATINFPTCNKLLNHFLAQ